ncbi:glycoside hydrolase [Sorangium cellulosum]|uniref:Glycoside hydrolase n=1 Tax=Sorangium cellulosum TaxID=56 RepID=A0A2L0EN57_SORCE|nr:1,4-alpha-glucan branching protein domain-containing protein [Sorangium cellulosum]AUX40741.1 glycoside hydrolase [Sorangium cellulosum]
MPGYVALVLHAHLPYVRHPEHARSLEERWFFEALWECYLPLLGVLDRLAEDHVAAPLTLSVSPPLLAMLRDELLLRRFDDHLRRLTALAARVESRVAGSGFAAAAAFYRARLASASSAWAALGGDVPGALVRHAEAGRIALLTTAATHAYLPGLLPTPASIRAQLRLGRRAFAALTGAPEPAGFWLPECAYAPGLDADLAAAGVQFTVLDAHGLELAAPAPAAGAAVPVLSPAGVVCFGRDHASAREVWSRDAGYPGHPAYREFYRDVGLDLPERDLDGEIGPDGTRLMTGLKLHRVTGPGPHKEPYDPARASAQARAHAAEFVARREAALGPARGAPTPPIHVAPYDAELFGHWWLEGPEFLEHALRRLAASDRAVPIALGAYLERHPPAEVVEPAASTWGEGGFGSLWTGPSAARLWRHVHHAERAVRGALSRCRGAGGLSGRALDQALRELLLLQSSDWAFMMATGEMVPYAEARVRAHAARAPRLARLAELPSIAPADAAWIDALCALDPFLAELPGPALRDAFDPWR